MNNFSRAISTKAAFSSKFNFLKFAPLIMLSFLMGFALLVETQISDASNNSKTVNMLKVALPKLVAILDDDKLVGGGCIISETGDIASVFHVVNGRAKLGVRFSDGQKLAAVAHKLDQSKDLAWLKVKTNGKKLPFFRLSPKSPPVGTTVFSIGHPFRIENSVTKGIVSGHNRTIDFSGTELHGLLQTDAALNPGSSGGGLISLRGELIALNCGILNGGDNLGVCVPVEQIRKFLQEDSK